MWRAIRPGSCLYWRSQIMTALIVSPFEFLPLSVKVIVFPSLEITLCLVVVPPSSNFKTTSAVWSSIFLTDSTPRRDPH